MFQNRIVQVETSPEEKEEDDEADKDLDPELRREKMEKNQIYILSDVSKIGTLRRIKNLHQTYHFLVHPDVSNFGTLK